MLKQTLGSNASEVIEEVKEKLEELAEVMPPSMDYKVSYDVSTFLDASIEQVLHTLREAFILVALVVFLFLGDWRSTLIPDHRGAGVPDRHLLLHADVRPVDQPDHALRAGAGDRYRGGQRHRGGRSGARQDGGGAPFSPYAAAKEVMGEISGAIIAITLVMISVFIPVTFMTGPVGVFYRQFSITMAASIILSASWP